MTEVDYAAIKVKQQATWSTGDYAQVGATLQLMGELLCEAMDVRAGWRVLDVAAANGNATLAAARRGCRVTSTDYVPALLERGRMRAEAEGWRVEFREADAENLPFADEEFDAVMSTVGVMFAPNQDRAASELMRVVKPGGRIGLACWTPAGFVGEMFRCIAKYVPPLSGLRPPMRWGTQEGLEQMFAGVAKMEAEPRMMVFRAPSPEQWLEHFRMLYGPMNRTYAALDDAGRAGLTADLLGLVARMNRADDGTMVVGSEYLEIVITR